MAIKKFQELDLSNAFLFVAAMSDKEICRLVLEIILGISVGKLTVHTEHSILYSSDYKSVRLDVFASNEMQVDFDIEMENSEKELAKRSRFYQVRMDSATLEPGEDYGALTPNYIIFICTYDPFGYGLYRYVFENRCLERNFPLGDGTTKIFLSTKGKNSNEVSEGLVNFLHYVEDSSNNCVEKLQDDAIKKLHKRIASLKQSRTWERYYMTIGDLMRRSEIKAEQRGQKQGEDKLLQLITFMTQNGEAGQIPRLSEDSDYLEEMYQKYGLTLPINNQEESAILI